jgi:hypothetical protein
MVTTVEIGDRGERLVARWLTRHGYSTNIDTRGAGSTDIEAWAFLNPLLVQVKTAVSPNTPCSLTAEEERAIKTRAACLGVQAWEARVQLDEELQQVGVIQWRRLA